MVSVSQELGPTPVYILFKEDAMVDAGTGNDGKGIWIKLGHIELVIHAITLRRRPLRLQLRRRAALAPCRAAPAPPTRRSSSADAENIKFMPLYQPRLKRLRLDKVMEPI
ncbi:hypothetical protein AAHA92_16670 [Salvia divinorum]|uniref:Uncharacterized protein n=1 Tax=Salvia divinorum TaxID=28513 RepID=A0ABD1GZP3_SALDI